MCMRLCRTWMVRFIEPYDCKGKPTEVGWRHEVRHTVSMRLTGLDRLNNGACICLRDVGLATYCPPNVTDPLDALIARKIPVCDPERNYQETIIIEEYVPWHSLTLVSSDVKVLHAFQVFYRSSCSDKWENVRSDGTATSNIQPLFKDHQ